MEAQYDDLHALDDRKRLLLEEKFRAHSIQEDRRAALAFLSDYSEKDVYVAIFPPDSLTDWPVSGPGRKKLMNELNTTYFSVKLTVELVLYRQREKLTNDARTHRWTRAIDLDFDILSPGLEKDEIRQFRQNLTHMINASTHDDQVDNYAIVNLKIPPYFLAPPEGELVDARPMTAGEVFIEIFAFLLTVYTIFFVTDEEMKKKRGNYNRSFSAVEDSHQEIRARFKLVDMSPRPDHWRMEMKKDVTNGASQYLFDPPPVDGIGGVPERRHIQLMIFVDRVVPSWMAWFVGSGGSVFFLFFASLNEFFIVRYSKGESKIELLE